MTREQIGIWIIVGVMVFSVFGVGLAVVLQDNPQNAVENIIAETEPDPIFPEGAYVTEEDVTELEIVDLTEGEGEEVSASDIVTVHYQGTLANTGQQFDSSYDRGQPATFSLDGLIEGWSEGIPGMKVGGTRRLVIPAEKGYGVAGSPPLIPANADLVFEIELISFEEAPEPVQDTQEATDNEDATEADSTTGSSNE